MKTPMNRIIFFIRRTIMSVVVLTVLSCTGNESGLDKYGGWTDIKGEKTGFFHLENIDGRDWFITPDGNAFFGVALSHLYSGESDVAFENIYKGDYELYMKETFMKAKDMGFNCALGSVTSPERNLNGFVDIPRIEMFFEEQNFPYAVGVILLKHPWEFVEGEDLPDIFEDSYRKLIEKRAAAVCPQAKDKPLVMGYYYGFGAFNHADYWINQYLALPAGSAGRNAIVDVLINRYEGNAEHFNGVYGTSLAKIDELRDEEVLIYEKAYEKRNYSRIRETLDPVKVADFDAILDHMAITLYKIGHDAIRKYDSNHLIFGSFVKEFAISPDTWKAAAPYMDMIAPQHINKEVDVHTMAKSAGLPILMSDEYAGWHYPGGHGSMHAGLESHDARGEVYKANLMRHYKDSKVLGVSYCACMYDQGGNTLAKNNQNGFYSLDGQPREKLIKAVTQLNRTVYQHATKPASPEELEKLHTELFGKWKEHSVRRRR